MELVKKYKKAVTLAIGDGANDVSMIKCKFLSSVLSFFLSFFLHFVTLAFGDEANKVSMIKCKFLSFFLISTST